MKLADQIETLVQGYKLRLQAAEDRILELEESNNKMRMLISEIARSPRNIQALDSHVMFARAFLDSEKQ